MSSTVTTTSVTTATTVGLVATLSLILVITLLALLIKKEIVSNTTAPWASALSARLNTAIIPLAVAFAFLLIVQVLNVLG